jgi:PPOX class probable F420-dependent enzyme
MSVADEISRSRYISLVTRRKDGTEVPTPVWHAPHNGELYLVSEARAGKVKRIGNSGQVVVTVCDIRGRVKPGAASAPGTARLLDDAGTKQARDLIARRYLLSRLGNGFARLFRLKRPPLIGIAIALT